MLKKFMILAAGAALLAQAVQPAMAQRRAGDNWERLGCVDARRRSEREVVEVGRRDGAFAAIRLEVVRNDANVEDLRVVYGNGDSETLRVRNRLREGAQTRAIDLQGRRRAIRRIVVTLRKARSSDQRGAVRLCVSGLEARKPIRRPQPRGRRTANWQELGCADTGLRKDFDTVQVGRRDGRFSAIRLRAAGGKVNVRQIRVIYGNGQPDRIEFSGKLDRGDVSGPLNLKGGDRFIKRIELVSKRDTKDAVKSIFKGVLTGRGPRKARVCIEGLEDDRFSRRRNRR